MHGKSRWLVLIVLAVIAATVIWGAVRGRRPDVRNSVAMLRPPRISPDYSGVVVPPNLAPLNFAIREEARRFLVRIGSETSDTIEIVSRSPEISIPSRPWRALLEANRGKDLWFEVYAEVESQWQRYQAIVNHIAQDEIDGYLVYRVVGPIHNKWRETAVYQRSLADHDVSAVLEGRSFDGGCVNCHSFPAGDPRRMLLGIRSGRFGKATLLAEGGTVTKLGTPFGYTAWHPSGRLAAYSVNKVRQFFHSAGAEVRDVMDLDGSLAYYRVDTQESKPVPRASDQHRLETYPAWSPDGRYLYYCGAPFLWTDRNAWPPDRYAEVQYDLMRIAYAPETDQWGEPETVLSAEETGLSILMPRVSPDGKFLLFCMCQYGCFPIHQPTSDLYLMTLADGSYRRLEINSEFSESWHSWSSNSRWIAFSSRRLGGFFTRCYLSYVDETGRAHKAFVVPQADPAFYDGLLKSICVPELVTGPVQASQRALARAVKSQEATAVNDRSVEMPRGDDLEPYQREGS